MNSPGDRLRAVLSRHDRLAVAVSGGVDSLTLAYCAAKWVPDYLCIHAISPAVPAEATQRVERYAAANRWPIRIVRSGEFDDPAYRANPHDRCYFCKTNLYSTMSRVFDGAIASGTNTDDLGDYRPGLKAATEHQVVHPFVEAGISKEDLREIARGFGLHDIADLPAQPCLASRIETGIRVSQADLEFIHRVEIRLRRYAPRANLRCRILAAGVRIETDHELPGEAQAVARQMCLAENRSLVGIGAYSRGSAFIVPEA
jgi:uncharacterized protein